MEGVSFPHKAIHPVHRLPYLHHAPDSSEMILELELQLRHVLEKHSVFQMLPHPHSVLRLELGERSLCLLQLDQQPKQELADSEDRSMKKGIQ